jgi:RNA polymerase sigma-70 factor (ECF subfamily)
VIDEDAFHALYRDTAAPLRAYVARVLGGVGQADDIVQETYLRALRAPCSGYDPTQVRAYLFRIASNLIADHFRRQKRESPLGEVPERAAPARDDSARIDMARVFRLLRVRDRQLLWLAHVEGANYHELAEALGLREGSVRVLLSRARRKLAALIEARER